MSYKPRVSFGPRVTVACRESWLTWAGEHGVSLAALVEAIGRDFASGGRGVPEDCVPEARRIDAERRRRDKHEEAGEE